MTYLLRAILTASLLASGASAEGPGGPSTTGARFVTLGTGGGPVMRLKRSQPANAVVVDGDIYLFDTGDGTERQMLKLGLRLPQVKAVFVSHHHIDHIGGLASLLVNRWVLGTQSPLPLIGPPGTTTLARAIGQGFVATEFATDTLGKERSVLSASIAARDLPATMPVPQLVYSDAKVRVLAVANAHYHYPAGSAAAREARSYSYRIEAAGRSFVFTGDTGVSPAVEALARGADVLISEVMDAAAIQKALSRQPGLAPDAAARMVANMSRDHLLPEEVGDLASRAKVKSVILTHLVPGRDDETGTEGYVLGVKSRFSGPVTVASDLDRF